MAVQTLEQIYASLGSVYDPQAALIRKQQADIPTQIAEEEKGLQAKQERSFGEILGGARQRGMGFSGIPLQEQAKYTATEFLPAMARLRQTGRQQATTLEEAILGINERRRTFAQQIREGDLARDMQERQLAEQKRQFQENLRLQREQMADQRRAAASGGGGFSPTIGGGAPAGAGKPLMGQRQNGGFDFVDASGKPISAARYAQLTKQPIGNILHAMGKAGDKYAQQLYNQIRSNQGWFNDPRNKAQIIKTYSPIFWGT